MAINVYIFIFVSWWYGNGYIHTRANNFNKVYICVYKLISICSIDFPFIRDL